MDHIQIICLRIVFFDNTLTHLNCRNGNLWTTSDTPSDLISSITQYDEEYCQQMLSASLKFAKDIHFKYFNDVQSALYTLRICRKYIMSGSHDRILQPILFVQLSDIVRNITQGCYL